MEGGRAQSTHTGSANGDGPTSPSLQRQKAPDNENEYPDIGVNQIFAKIHFFLANFYHSVGQ